jgi:hypothetical protein
MRLSYTPTTKLRKSENYGTVRDAKRQTREIPLGVRNLTFPSHSLATLWCAASDVLLLIWEGQPRHACQAHWGMDSTQQPFRNSCQLIIRKLLLHSL